jgi:hypothetical protein
MSQRLPSPHPHPILFALLLFVTTKTKQIPADERLLVNIQTVNTYDHAEQELIF